MIKQNFQVHLRQFPCQDNQHQEICLEKLKQEGPTIFVYLMIINLKKTISLLIILLTKQSVPQEKKTTTT